MGRAAINFDGAGSEKVREFCIGNALYWLEEFGLDGLRLDAVHAIKDDSPEHFLAELSRRTREGPGKERHVHLLPENEENQASFLKDASGFAPYTAQWNDYLHHALLRKSIRVQGVYVGSREMFEEMNRAISLNKMRPVVDRTFPFEQAREALRHLEGASHFGKIVVTL